MTTKTSEKQQSGDIPEQVESTAPAPLTGYGVAAVMAADEGRAHQPIDQRTGRPVGPSALTPAQRQAELQAVAEAELREVDAFVETIRLAVGEPAPYGASGAFDQRKANELLRAALERISAQTDDSDRASLAARALQRIDKKNGLWKAGAGVRW